VNLAQPARSIDGGGMPAEAPQVHDPCVVCGMADARALTTTTLADGTRVPVCGSHELTHRRAVVPAGTTAELCGLAAERRRRHRRVVASDELAGMLSEAFAPARRGASERRRSG
jgi:hypothetical protein